LTAVAGPAASYARLVDHPIHVLLVEAELAAFSVTREQGDVPNTVFPCGVVHAPESGEVRLYYGAADSSICLATAHIDELLAAVTRS
jgi:hypothetical protein